MVNDMHSMQKRTDEFCGVVLKEFEFLLHEYEFKGGSIRVLDLEFPPDAKASIIYTGVAMGLEVVLGLGDDSISVVFFELENRCKPTKLSFYAAGDGFRAARLETILKVISRNAEFQFPLPEIGPELSVAEIIRRGEKRSRLIREDLPGVVAELARLVREYCGEILRGDVSRFSEFQEYHSKFWA